MFVLTYQKGKRKFCIGYGLAYYTVYGSNRLSNDVNQKITNIIGYSHELFIYHEYTAVTSAAHTELLTYTLWPIPIHSVHWANSFMSGVKPVARILHQGEGEVRVPPEVVQWNIKMSYLQKLYSDAKFRKNFTTAYRIPSNAKKIGRNGRIYS